MKVSKLIAVIAGFGLVVLFQNCAQTEFSPSETGGINKLVAEGDEANGTIAQTDSPSPAPAPAPSPAPPSGPGNSGNNGNNPPSDSEGAPGGPLTGLVECQVEHPNWKVIQGPSRVLADHSNSSRTRICMSENACLKLINSYAVARGCSLQTGAATSAGATGQCTEIFPGSKGTCHNAAVLSDDAVAKLLTAMGQ